MYYMTKFDDITSKFEWTLDKISHFVPNFAKKIFGGLALLTVRNCSKLQSWAVSGKTNDRTLRKWQKI